MSLEAKALRAEIEKLVAEVERLREENESDTYELKGTLENARYWHKRAEKAEAEVERLRGSSE